MSTSVSRYGAQDEGGGEPMRHREDIERYIRAGMMGATERSGWGEVRGWGGWGRRDTIHGQHSSGHHDQTIHNQSRSVIHELLD